jgi:hypothetical protein
VPIDTTLPSDPPAPHDDLPEVRTQPSGRTPDQDAAHEFLCELRTRISTQPLPYQYGVEARALESLWEVFAQARAAMKNHPGCEKFAQAVTTMLNVELRPVTAKWHRAHTEGQLNSRDGADEFREDLQAVQIRLQQLASDLHEMAYGTRFSDQLTGPAITEAEIDKCFESVAFGIPKSDLIPDDIVAAINSDESDAVKLHRAAHKIAGEPGKDAVGLALSGGGIRSATFCLGVTQVLAARKLLQDVDFLSTVSGGGYVGCFLTTRLGKNGSHEDVAGPHGPDPGPVRYLRQHAKYLSANGLKEQWSMVTATIAGMILNWTAPLFLIALAALIGVGIKSGYGNPPWAPILAVAGGVTLFTLILYAFFMRFTRHSGGTLLGFAAAVTALLGFFWFLSFAYGKFEDLTLTWSLAGIVAAAVTVYPAIVRFIPVLKKPAIRSLVLKGVLLAAGLIIPLAGIVLAFLFFKLGMKSHAPDASFWSPFHYMTGTAVLVIIVVFFALIAICLLNINLTGPHRLYRNQLARTFVQESEDATAAIPLVDINPNNYAPYHLINATANLPSSTSASLRERKSDFFLISKYWCGAPSTGYEKTSNWQANRAPFDIATAMAVSGAAASSYMGLGSMPSLTALLTFLNVRLGFWIIRPGRNRPLKTPGFLCLLREMTGIAMSEKQAWLNLSDGGHIENMAVYELLRRRCKFIISVDGEADPQSTFHGHLTLVRHAQIDFGIRIDPNLNDLRPDTASRFSQRHIMFCRVLYPAMGGQPAAQGLILYIKLSVTGNEMETVKRYRNLNPDFPHQTTLDQFFDEEQFEVYRQLGVHVTEGLFSRALMNDIKGPPSIAVWFRWLAQKLLVPERA